MPLVVKDRVKVTTTTTGTGTLTLGAAATGFQSFSVIGDGNTTYYTIAGGAEFEVGIGTFTLSGTTLSRDTILESSNSGSAVNFSAGTKDVFVTYPAERAVYTDSAGTTITPATSSRLGYANLAQGSALSVLGVTGNSTADNASIAAGTDHQVLRRSGTAVAFGAVNLAQSAAITGTLPVGNGGTGITSLGTGVATFLGTPSSANLAAAVTNETGSGALVFATSPTLVTPALGTPASGNLANCTFPTLNQNTTGNAATATALQTARTIGGVSFNGTANINLPGVNTAGNQNTTGSAASLTTARTIGGVSFNGTANINLPGVNVAGNQNTTGSSGSTTGNAATATVLQTARTINGTSFNGSANITVPGDIPSGTVMLFVQTAAPTGFTKSTTHNNKALRIVSGAVGTGGSVAFTTAFASQAVSGTNANQTATGTVGGTTISTAQLPAHTHQFSLAPATNGAPGGGGRLNQPLSNNRATSSTGGGESHTHTFTGTSHTHTFTGTAINLAVQYVDVIIATKD